MGWEETLASWPCNDAQNTRPREYRSQTVPGQKTNVAANRKNRRDLCTPSCGIAINAIVPVIRPLPCQKTGNRLAAI